MRTAAIIVALLLSVVSFGGCGKGGETTDLSQEAVSEQGDAHASEERTVDLPNDTTVGKDTTPKNTESIVNSIGMRLKLISPGEFLMGSPEGEQWRQDDEQQHLVRITKPFYLGVHEVMQGEWEAVMNTRPWVGKDCVEEGTDYATTYVSWHDANEFCRHLSKKEGRTYRLPTEAEWEYACRADTESAFSFGSDASDLGAYGWYAENAYHADEKYAHRVGEKRANSWGLHDMHGNVWEWCQDWLGTDYHLNAPVDDPVGATGGVGRMARGGGWGNYPRNCRSAVRGEPYTGG